MSLKIVLFFSVFVAFSPTRADKIDKSSLDSFDNLHQVDSILWRSEQPSKKGMEQIYKLGIKTIINLREKQKDTRKTVGLDFTLLHHPIVAWKINEQDVVAVMQLIEKAEKPILIHCKHGSDRTGCIIGTYRMLYNGWSKEQAIAELKDPKHGYHKFWFPEIEEILENLDIEKLKTDI